MFNPMLYSVSGSARVSSQITPSSSRKVKKPSKVPIIMVEESAKPRFKFRNRNNVLGGNYKTLQTGDRTALEMYKNAARNRNFGSPIQNSLVMQSFASNKRNESSNLREQLHRITVDLDDALSQPQKARRTRKERRLNTMANNSRNGTTLLIQDNVSLNSLEANPKPKFAKRQPIKSPLTSLETRCNTARAKNNINAKENKIKNSTKASEGMHKANAKASSRLNKVVPVHRRCLTRMIQLNDKEKKTPLLSKPIANKESLVNEVKKPVHGSVNKKPMQGKQLRN
eukprot:TRINITY_DN12524_c0_g1_i3.p1 TRINITY_DN12524_c0_g1~~TRINITY_DN12524_c0_g1_i3.p1  ORF type:complete len:284 (-),score=52.42 TRINITY_DN12524_c0_g1_i3:156-1007(-)